MPIILFCICIICLHYVDRNTPPALSIIHRRPLYKGPPLYGERPTHRTLYILFMCRYYCSPASSTSGATSGAYEPPIAHNKSCLRTSYRSQQLVPTDPLSLTTIVAYGPPICLQQVVHTDPLSLTTSGVYGPPIVHNKWCLRALQPLSATNIIILVSVLAHPLWWHRLPHRVPVAGIATALSAC